MNWESVGRQLLWGSASLVTLQTEVILSLKKKNQFVNYMIAFELIFVW